MNSEQLQQERRKQNALERLGSNHPACVVCGLDDWRCLERHHIAGRAHGDELAIVCRNCHRKLSDAQHDHPASSAHPTRTEQIGHLLLGIADLLRLLVEKLAEFGRYLIETTREGNRGRAGP